MKGNIVRYNFLGLDTHDKEVFTLDYAIVLNEADENNNIRILPFTNRFNKESMESFCIGKVNGFIEVRNEGFVSNDLYVRFDKMLTVKADELYPVYAQDTYGRLTFDESGNKILVRIDDLQAKRIDAKLALYEEGEEKCACNVITKADNDFDIDYEKDAENPIFNLGFEELDKYKEYNFEDQKILVFFIKGERYSLIMHRCEPKSIEYRNSKIKEYFAVRKIG